MQSKLTYETSIPAAVRGNVRAYVKSRKEWDSYCAAHDIVSREAKNAQLVAFAIDYGYAAGVEQLMSNAMPSAPHAVAGIDEPDYDLIVPESPESPENDPLVTYGDEPLPESEAVMLASDNILSAVDQFLSPFVRAEIEKALAPVIAAANKPALVREVEKIVHLAPQPVAPKGETPYATKGNEVELGKLFGFRGAHAKKRVHLWESHGAAPAVDPYFVVDPYRMAMIATAFDRGENVWLVGPGGSGKTTMPQQFCAYTNRPFVRINFTRNSHTDDMTGGQGVKNGNSGWEDGVLIQAMRRPGTVILLDEITLAPAGVQGLFQGCADEHRTYTLPTGEKVVAAAGVVFCVADNTAGNGDDTGLYHGTNPANGALVNRFARMLRVEYMSVATEAAALHNHTKAPLAACMYLAEFVARVRALPAMENAIMSLRNMCAFTRVVIDGFSVAEAADVTILSRMVATERATVETLFTLQWNEDFATLMAGGALAVPANPNGYADGGAFDDNVTAELNR
jgi:hypothetical protein